MATESPLTEPTLNGWQMLGDYLGAIQLAQAMRCKAAAGRAELIINAELASTGAEQGGQPVRFDMEL